MKGLGAEQTDFSPGAGGAAFKSDPHRKAKIADAAPLPLTITAKNDY